MHSALYKATLQYLSVGPMFSHVRVGGLIQDMAWDSTGERLAVIFKGNKDTGNALEKLLHYLTPDLHQHYNSFQGNQLPNYTPMFLRPHVH